MNDESPDLQLALQPALGTACTVELFPVASCLHDIMIGDSHFLLLLYSCLWLSEEHKQQPACSNDVWNCFETDTENCVI